tara:strand:- start:371 stop:715 length:345 start_codon:yes stop_codon:yes gene_type:complete
MSKLNGKELANELTNFVNNYNCDHEEFINAFCREHRTLQQSSFRLFLMLLDRIASDEYSTDLRNESSHKVAKKMINGFKKVIIEEQIARGSSKESANQYAESDYAKPHKFLGHI